MKSLAKHLEAYLNLRHKLGFKLRVQAGLLARFVDFARQKKASVISTKLALSWATGAQGCQPTQWANRLGMVRRFARYVSGVDPRADISSQELLPVTGMRVREDIGLYCQDVDLKQGLLTVRNTKCGKSRLVPIHQTTQSKLQDYERLRDGFFPRAKTPSFFLSERGTRLTDCTFRHWFIVAFRKIGLRGAADSHGPRIHDLRHRFAVKTILNWYRRGVDVEAHLPELTTYMGHGHVTDTYWYISSTPELLKLATQRLERRNS